MYRPLGFDFSASASTAAPPQISLPSVDTPRLALPQVQAPQLVLPNVTQTIQPESVPRVVVPAETQRPVVYDKDGKRYTAPYGNYEGQDPANVYCQGGNTPPCACVTQQLKDYILSQGLCKITDTPSGIRGIGSVYSIYSQSTGWPTGAFKWFDKWITDVGPFNPCDIVRLPVCKTDCNSPWYEPVRLAGEYGYCKSTRTEQVASVYVPHAPVTSVPACAKGTHASSGGCVPDVGSGTSGSSSSSYVVGGLLLLLLVGGGTAYYLSQKKGKRK